MEKKNILALTHAGVFHADDVFASAFLRALNPEIEVQRVFSVPEGFEGLAFDVGGGKYDHHEPEGQKERRANGFPYAAFGKLWRDFAPELIPQERVELIDEEFIQYIDKADNTIDKTFLSMCIKVFNPSWNEGISPNEKFEEAVDMAQTIIKGLLWNQRSKRPIAEIFGRVFSEELSKAHSQKAVELFNKNFVERFNEPDINNDVAEPNTLVTAMQYVDEADAEKIARALVREALKSYEAEAEAEEEAEKAFATAQNGIVILDRFVPIVQMAIPTSVTFVIYPSLRGGYNVQNVQKEEGKNDKKVPFPQDWLGKPVDYLQKIVPGFTFCHPGNFLAATQTLEAALAVTQKATELQG